MPNIREGFPRDACQNPNALVGVDRGISLTQNAMSEEVRRHQTYVSELATRFSKVGLSWKTCLASDPSKDKLVRQQWKELLREFAVANENERPSFLFAFSHGLGLSQDSPKGFPAHSQYPLDAYQQMPGGKRFSRASRIFIEVISDISGINEREKNAFRESLNNRKDLQLNYVHLKQTFPGIAHWMVRQSKRSVQSSMAS